MQEQDDHELGFLTNHSLHADELRETAVRIKERDRRLYEGARSYWLQTGHDLIRAKELLGHGRFEAWCARELAYSKSKAEKLMRTAEVFGQHLKSVTVTDLPQPTVLYALSAPSVPQDLRNRFIPRIIAGQQVGSEVRQAIKQHREKVERETHCPPLSPEAKADHGRRAAQRAKREARKAAQRDAELEQQVAARSEALSLIVTRVGDDLPKLLALVAKAASGSVFESAAEQQLQQQASTIVSASVTQVKLPAVEAAQETAGTIIERLESDLDPLAEPLERADPDHLVRTIRSALHKQPEAGRALDQPRAEGGHGAQPEISPAGTGESIGPGEAAREAPAPEVVSGGQNAADPGSVGRTATVADTLSGGGTASANTVDSHDLAVPEFLRRTESTHLCKQPAGNPLAQGEAEAVAGEHNAGSTLSWPSPAPQTPIRTSGADRAHGGRSNEPTFRRMGTRGRRDKQP